MKDTSDEIESYYRRKLLARTGEERLLMGDSMYATARQLVLASINKKNSESGAVELKRALFLRFYGNDFTSEECRKILSAL
ncbi:MAG: hypothetical protein M1536_06485 [Firmicutes bacterium]|nr:hypothetical protein [Bacillota bacterium]